MRRASRILTTAVVTLAIAAGGAAPVAAAPPELVPGLPVHLALGDSVAAGQQSAAPTVDFETTAALWKANGYVAQFHETLRQRLDCLPARSVTAKDGCRQLQLLNLSRTGIPGGPGGVTTTTMLSPGDQLDQAVALLEERNQNRSPRDDVEVITLTVGGNDLFGPAVAACVPPSASCGPTLAATYAGFAERYDQILGALRAAAGEDTVLMTTTYYNPLPFCVLGASDPVGATALGNWILEGGDLGFGALPLGFNDVIRAVSAEHGATVADTFGTLGAEDFVGGTDCTHPDEDGHRTLATVFADAFVG